ncbi:MAG: RNA polymerase sigma factor [Gammaproteobacteria bacterium]|nr:RNA polymerase sigma factor [Gammaproteobacteria bacterium]
MAFFIRHHQQLQKRLEELRPRLFRVACAWCGSGHQADDIVQEAMIKALKRLDQLKDPESLSSWVFSILANCHRDACRGQRYTEEVLDLSQHPQPSAEEEVIVAQRIHRVRRAIDRLSQGQRETMMLVDLEGFSYAEVAEILQLPIGTVMSRLNRGRQQLRTLLLRKELQEPGSVVQLERVK